MKNLVNYVKLDRFVEKMLTNFFEKVPNDKILTSEFLDLWIRSFLFNNYRNRNEELCFIEKYPPQTLPFSFLQTPNPFHAAGLQTPNGSVNSGFLDSQIELVVSFFAEFFNDKKLSEVMEHPVATVKVFHSQLENKLETLVFVDESYILQEVSALKHKLLDIGANSIVLSKFINHTVP